MSNRKLERVTTTWQMRFTTCQRCWEINPRKTWPVPAQIKNEIKQAVENKIKQDCYGSGAGINTGPSLGVLPPVANEGKLVSSNPATWCLANYTGKEVICGYKCGGLSSPYNRKSTFDRLGFPAPCWSYGSNWKPSITKQTCSGRIIVGSDKPIKVTAKYEITYGVEMLSGPCKGKRASETRTYERTSDMHPIITIVGKHFIDNYSNKHCCRGAQRVDPC
jgi:hypothetical protein